MASFEVVEKFNDKDIDKKTMDILFEVEETLIRNEDRFSTMNNKMTRAISILVCDFILKTKSLDFYEVDFYQNCKLKLEKNE
jgi:hypothetical protein